MGVGLVPQRQKSREKSKNEKSKNDKPKETRDETGEKKLY
jgi:hypothetical protein